MAMATVDEARQKEQDAEQHRKIYKGIMKAGGEVGVPASLALAMFFTQLVLANGILVAFASFVAVYVFVWWIVRTFFSH